jgi:hypothetical protein
MMQCRRYGDREQTEEEVNDVRGQNKRTNSSGFRPYFKKYKKELNQKQRIEKLKTVFAAIKRVILQGSAMIQGKMNRSKRKQNLQILQRMN